MGDEARQARFLITGGPYDDSDPVMAALARTANDGSLPDNARAACALAAAEIKLMRAQWDDAIELISMIEDREGNPVLLARGFLETVAPHVPTNVRN